VKHRRIKGEADSEEVFRDGWKLFDLWAVIRSYGEPGFFAVFDGIGD